MKKKTIYLANPYGFSESANRLILPLIKRELEGLGLEVWEPFERNNQHQDSQDAGYIIGQQDKEDTIKADAIFAVVNGEPPDPGVMVELGIAIALNKPTFLFRDEYISSSDTYEYPLNLMIFTGLPKRGWRTFYYEKIDEINCPTKGLVQWLASERKIEEGPYTEEFILNALDLQLSYKLEGLSQEENVQLHRSLKALEDKKLVVYTPHHGWVRTNKDPIRNPYVYIPD